jgi:hypothetical protein
VKEDRDREGRLGGRRPGSLREREQRGRHCRLPQAFASVRQCRYVMDKEDIPEDEWMPRRAAIAAEHKMPGAGDSSSLRAGFKEWLRLPSRLELESVEVRYPWHIMIPGIFPLM